MDQRKRHREPEHRTSTTEHPTAHRPGRRRLSSARHAPRCLHPSHRVGRITPRVPRRLRSPLLEYSLHRSHGDRPADFRSYTDTHTSSRTPTHGGHIASRSERANGGTRDRMRCECRIHLDVHVIVISTTLSTMIYVRTNARVAPHVRGRGQHRSLSMRPRALAV